ncbi:MAG: hypothetical protein ABSE59_05215 [Opitutaceae bacterium]
MKLWIDLCTLCLSAVPWGKTPAQGARPKRQRRRRNPEAALKKAGAGERCFFESVSLRHVPPANKEETTYGDDLTLIFKVQGRQSALYILSFENAHKFSQITQSPAIIPIRVDSWINEC